MVITPDVIIHAIREISSKYSLNVTKISIKDKFIQWCSPCGVLGDVYTRVSLEKHYRDIDPDDPETLKRNLRDISTILAFTNLLNIPENHKLAEKVKLAKLHGAPTLFRVKSGHRFEFNVGYIDSREMLKFKPISVKYIHNSETGEYQWRILDDGDSSDDDSFYGNGYDDDEGDFIIPNNKSLIIDSVVVSLRTFTSKGIPIDELMKLLNTPAE